jgi:fructose-1,6-bisphosphatase I
VELDNEGGKYIVYMDPLDGSSNIDVNVSVGSIFSIYLNENKGRHSLRVQDAVQPGVKQLTAGYILFGSSTIMVYTTGIGVSMFTLDPSIGEFMLGSENITIPDHGMIYSVNEGNYKSWPEGLKKYVKHCQEEQPNEGRPYKARYIGSMVADVHRTLLKGGIFMYPDSNQYPSGKLRLMYECNPLSMVIEQAGGMAINGARRIMEITPGAIHQRTPIYIGSQKNVMKAKALLKNIQKTLNDLSLR